MPENKDTETEIIRRQMTPRELYFNRWFNGVWVPTILAFQATFHVVAMKYQWETVWFDMIVTTTVAYSTAMGGFMDGLWRRRQDERVATDPVK